MMKTKQQRGVDFYLDPGETLRAGPGFRLDAVDPESTPGYDGRKADGARHLDRQDARLDDLQERLFAASKGGSDQRVLLVLQAMDTAGKGGIVSHVVGTMDPQGVHLKAFKAPTDQEKAHDFLWRIEKEVPEAGMVGVFDRSHYEDVLIHRVHGWADEAELERRYAAINDFESRLMEQGTTLVKVMLHISKDEQKDRLLARLHDPAKHWKYTTNDLAERGFWDDYQAAFQIMLEKTSTAAAPWHVIPANRKWYARIAVQQLLIDALERIGPQWPAADFDVDEQIAAVSAS
ncbi:MULTISPECIES: polyphosphate kinase 2 family protein [Arthrobacter]|uniref:Polyphosphate kinase 2 family protein n=2 Tax=Arthrobacter TaxID=1663 RepID=A0ABU9KP03_9MICC|nr:polyphosphate kinase 2 family protein [Arthrobacter sp. YJM1]MDP5227085.1 polyphosphate kinase 2 family protein [Arthrobacter sp. YJM1]